MKSYTAFRLVTIDDLERLGWPWRCFSGHSSLLLDVGHIVRKLVFHPRSSDEVLRPRPSSAVVIWLDRTNRRIAAPACSATPVVRHTSVRMRTNNDDRIMYDRFYCRREILASRYGHSAQWLLARLLYGKVDSFPSIHDRIHLCTLWVYTCVHWAGRVRRTVTFQFHVCTISILFCAPCRSTVDIQTQRHEKTRQRDQCACLLLESHASLQAKEMK